MPAALIGHKPILRRYTDLPSLLYLLETRGLTLLDPKSWDDTNDSYFLLKYKERKNLGTVLALCLTSSDETYHHWRVFSPGPAGVCLHLDQDVLTSAIQSRGDIMGRKVTYRKIRGPGNKSLPPVSVDDLPFLKRSPYEPEGEFRLLYENSAKHAPFLDVPIPESAILKVTLSPWLNRRLAKTVKATIHGVRGWSALKIVHSTLVGNTEWKRIGDSAT